MAFRWRIRHKLLLGLALVVCIIVLLLTGTLYGLESFRATIKSIDRKHAELNAATDVRTAVNELRISTGDTDRLPRYQDKIHDARKKLQDYQQQLEHTVAGGRDPERGSEESGYIEDLGRYLTELASTASAVFA
ncbi:MAG TPA: hypothetical protein VFA18_15050, partial [Gemmataceae bacterium]|nr:hypothetical protein [Gemmataceae bacterium]